VADVVGVEVVGVGGVDDRHAGVEGGVDRADRPLFVRPALDRHRHAAETDRADFDIADSTLFHEQTSSGVRTRSHAT
jgi:hypothetical protein